MGQDKPDERFDEPQFLEYALSCGLLIHRRAFEKAGLFDPGYFFQFDDWDFSQRVRAHGLHIQLVPAAEIGEPCPGDEHSSTLGGAAA